MIGSGGIELGQNLREDAGGVNEIVCEDAVGDFRGAGAGSVVEVAFRDRPGAGGDGCRDRFSGLLIMLVLYPPFSLNQ